MSKSLSSSEIYIIALLSMNFIGGILNVIYLISFISSSSSRFLSSRNPSLIIVYCIIGLVISFTTTPLDLYYHSLPSLHVSPPPFFALFVTEFFHELCTTMLLIVILCRSWLLFYDYKFSESSWDVKWRKVVNANEDNWFIKHRKTFGNLHFIICLALIFISVSLLGLSGVGAAVLKVENSQLFHYLSIFGLGIPLFIFIIYLTQFKISIINDVYLIHLEIKYLSYCILARIVAFMVNIILNGYDEFLIFYTMEVLTTFLSVWIQCRWVINQLQKREKQKEMDLYIVMNHNENKMKNKGLLGMIDIFDDEIAFETFIRHCTHELSVESILFLIEISQFKATLLKYNAFGIDALSFRFVDVIYCNFVKYIKKKRKEKEDEQIKIHPLYDDDDDLLPPPKLNNWNRSISLKSRQDTAVASMKQESEYKRFTETILSKKWLPLNEVLTLVKDKDKSKTNQSGTSGNKDSTEKSKTSTKTKTKTNFSATSMATQTITKTKSISRNNKKLAMNEFITPISLEVIGAHYSGYSSNDNTKEEDENNNNKNKNKNTPKSDKEQSKSGSNSDDKDRNDLSVDINWMMEYGRYLYLKYVDNSADLAINVSHHIRKDLWSVYSKEINEEAFQTIELMHHEDLSTMTRLTNKESHKFFQTFMYHSFDSAFHCVWQLLRSDTFYRFQKTKEYKKLCADADKEKIKSNKQIRDREYSQSYNDSQSHIV